MIHFHIYSCSKLIKYYDVCNAPSFDPQLIFYFYFPDLVGFFASCLMYGIYSTTIFHSITYCIHCYVVFENTVSVNQLITSYVYSRIVKGWKNSGKFQETSVKSSKVFPLNFE